MIDQELFEKLKETRDIGKSRTYEIIQEVRQEYGNTITKETAAHILASREGIDVEKYLESEELEKIRNLEMQKQAQPTAAQKETSRPQSKKSNKVIEVAGIDLQDPLLSSVMITDLKEMSKVYQMMYALENSVRNLIVSVMEDSYGEDWWSDKVSNKVQKKVEQRINQEGKTPWYGKRGGDEIFYTDFGDLVNIIRSNWSDFEDIIQDQHFLKSRIEELEPLRNVVAHHNPLSNRERDRIKLNYEEWIEMLKKNADLIPDDS